MRNHRRASSLACCLLISAVGGAASAQEPPPTYPTTYPGYPGTDQCTTPDTPTNQYCAAPTCDGSTAFGTCGEAAEGGENIPLPSTYSYVDDNGATVTGTRDRFTSCSDFVTACFNRFNYFDNPATGEEAGILYQVQRCLTTWWPSYDFTYDVIKTGAGAFIKHKIVESGELLAEKWVAKKISEHCAETCVPVIGWAIEVVDVADDIIEIAKEAFILHATGRTECTNQPCSDAWTWCNTSCDGDHQICLWRQECAQAVLSKNDPQSPDSKCFDGQLPDYYKEDCDGELTRCKATCQSHENDCVKGIISGTQY